MVFETENHSSLFLDFKHSIKTMIKMISSFVWFKKNTTVILEVQAAIHQLLKFAIVVAK